MAPTVKKRAQKTNQQVSEALVWQDEGTIPVGGKKRILSREFLSKIFLGRKDASGGSKGGLSLYDSILFKTPHL